MTPRHARPEDPQHDPDSPAPGPPGAPGDQAEPGSAPDPEPPVAPGPAEIHPIDDPDMQPAARARTRGGRGRGRVRWASLARIAAVVLLLIGGVALLAKQLDAGPPQPSTTPTPSATAFAVQQALLIQVRNDNDLGADNLIAGVGGGLPAAQVLVPSRLIVDVPGAGQQTLGQSARLLDRSASQDALSDLLAVKIDGTLSLGRLALAGMVDFVGGITLNIDHEISEKDPTTGQVKVVVPRGTVHLNGSQAATYALAWLPEEPEAARLARYSDVMTATISSLPDDQLRVEAMLTSLGGSARTTTTTSAVAAFLVKMRAEILAGGQQIRVLPTSDIESADALPVVRVDLVAADAMLEQVLPQTMIPPDLRRSRVLVQNGVGTPGLGSSARDKLVTAGLVYVNGGNAEDFGYKRTRIILPDSTPESLQTGAAIAKALGVPESAIRVAESGQNVADAVVILGRDFQP